MDTTIKQALVVLNDALNPQYSSDVAEKKFFAAQILAITALVEELAKANQIKERELRRLYGDDFI